MADQLLAICAWIPSEVGSGPNGEIQTAEKSNEIANAFDNAADGFARCFRVLAEDETAQGGFVLALCADVPTYCELLQCIQTLLCQRFPAHLILDLGNPRCTRLIFRCKGNARMLGIVLATNASSVQQLNLIGMGLSNLARRDLDALNKH